ncbi:MAG TPA: DUF5074 domain-containing protein [Moheibacter sp.]|nr:DUF5074 domain-containing protein [Moheibacter sp.]
MKKINFYLLGLFLLLIAACNSDDNGNETTAPPKGEFTQGVFVLNEGGFMHGNASISFIAQSGEIQNNIFSTVNNRPLGDVANSISFHGEFAFIVVNNSNTVEVVNRYTFESVATIAGNLSNPRYIEANQGKAYISNWGDGNDSEDDFIAVVDLNSFQITSTISVPQGPEKLAIHNNKLYIAQRGDYAYGNSISVMDLSSNTIVQSIEVADVPNGMEIDNGHLYVLSSGKAAWTGNESLGAMQKINLANHQTVDEFSFPLGVHPEYLQIEQGNIYYIIGNDIYKTTTTNMQATDVPFISTTTDGLGILYGFNVVNGWIYVCDAVDYVNNGQLFVYSLTGNLDSHFPIGGVIPNGVYFNY